LGIEFGLRESSTLQFRDLTRKVRELHEQIGEIGDSKVELVLLRSCASACKITHLLRAAAKDIDGSALREFDAALRTALERIVGVSLHAEAYSQSSLGVCVGGLGLRQAANCAIPAYLAARVMASPLVELLCDGADAEGVLPSSLRDILASDIVLARTHLRGCLTPARGQRMDDLLERARQFAGRRLSQMSGRCAPQNRQEDPVSLLVMPAGAEDPEMRLDDAPVLQRDLCALLDEETVDALMKDCEAQSLHDDVRRLNELRDPTVNHDWLWSTNPVHGPVVADRLFAPALRIRLGADFTIGRKKCDKCGHLMTTKCGHALCCASAESTRGHYAVRDRVLPLCRLADPTSEVEASDLIPSAPALRPADIFTPSALPGSRAALDIGIASPEATGSGNDCCAAMFIRKRKHYERHLPELHAQGIRYVPIVLSSFGRMHPTSYETIQQIARTAAMRQGIRNPEVLLRRTMRHIAVAIWERAAKMVLSCLPLLGNLEVELLGDDFSEGDFDGRGLAGLVR
jgi:hypothetical protein